MFGGPAGDGVDDLGAPLVAVEPTSFAGDVDSLAGVWEQDAGPRGDNLDAVVPAVASVAGGMPDRDLVSGQGF